MPAYPDRVWAVPPGEAGLLADVYAEFVANAVTAPSEATDRLCDAAAEAGVYVVMGVGEWVNTGDSAIVGPDGELLAGPVQNQETILYAEIDPRRMSGPKWMLDVAGHYARPDVFELTVHTDTRPMLRPQPESHTHPSCT